MSTVQPFYIDGDSTYSKDAEGNTLKRRLHGINAPETSHKEGQIGEAGGEEASARLGTLLAENPDAIWESITSDAYGRDVGRYVTADGRDINKQLVREGYAPSMSFNNQASPYLQAEADYVNDLHAGKADYAIEGGGFLPREPKQMTLTQEFGEAVQRGYDQTQGLMGFGASALARSVGADGISDYFQDIAVSNFQEASDHAATIGSYTDINFDDGVLDGLKDSARYAIGIVGEQVPQIGFDLVAALATGGLGAAASSAIKAGVKQGVGGMVAKTMSKATANKGLLASMTLQQVGEVESELINEGVDAPLTAIIGGIGAGAVDFLGAKLLMKSASDLYKKGSGVKANELLRQGLTNTAFEGATEGVQTVIAKGAVLHEKTGYDMFSDENMEEIYNAMIAGAIVGSVPAFVSGGAKTVKESIAKISKRNGAIIGATGTQAPESIAVRTTYIDANGDTVLVAEEAALPDELEAVKAAHQKRAKKAGVKDAITSFGAPTDTQAKRDEDGTSVVTENGDRTTESIRNLSEEFRGLYQNVKKTIVLTAAEFDAYRKTDNAYQGLTDVKVTRTSDGDVIISRGKDAHALVAREAKLYNPVEYTAAQFDEYLDEVMGDIADNKGSEEPATKAPIVLQEDEVLVQEEVEPDLEPTGADISDDTISQDEQEVEKFEASEEDIAPEAPKAKRKTKTGKDRAFGNKQSRSDLVDQQLADAQVVADESELGLDNNLVPEATVKANKEAEDSRVAKFDLDEKGVPVAPGQKAEKKEPEEAPLTGDVKPKIVLDNEAQAELDANAVEADEVDKLLQNARRNIDAKSLDGFSKQERRESIRTKVSGIAGFKVPDARIDAVTEELFNEMSSDSSTPLVDSGITQEEVSVAERTTEINRARAENEASEESATTGDNDDVASEQELFNGLSEKILDNREKEVYDEAVAIGIESVRKMSEKQALRDNRIDDWEELGYPSRIAMINARNALNDLIAKARLGHVQDTVYGGKKGEDLNQVISKFGKVNKETGEYEELAVYLPDVLKHLYNNSEARFETSASTSFAARMLNLYGEFLGNVSDLGLVPFDFNDNPNVINDKAHIAYQPSYSRDSGVYTLKGLQKDVKNTYKDVGSDASVDFMEVGQQQQMLDAIIELEMATEAYTKMLKSSSDTTLLIPQLDTIHALQDNIDTLRAKHKEEREEFEANRAQEGEVSGEAQTVEPERFTEASAPSTGSRKSKLGKPDPKPKKPVTFKENVRGLVRDILDTIGAVSRVGVRFDNNQKQIAQVILEGDTVAIVFNEKMLKELRDENPEAAAHVIAHEVGHVFTAETMHNIPADVLAGLHRDFKKAKANAPSGHPYRKAEGVGFDEWLADQFAVHMAKPLGEETKGFWSRIMKGLRAIANSIAPFFGLGRLDLSLSGQAFMESMFKAGVKNKTMSDSDFMNSLASMNLEFGGNYPRSRAQERRFFVENKALGKKTDNLKDSKQPRDFTLGQNLNKTSDLGRAAINAFDSTAGVAKNIVTNPSYIPMQASKLTNSIRKGAPLVFTSKNEMKHIKGGRRIAKMYENLFNSHVADSALWQNDASRSMASADKAALENFVKGEGDIPATIEVFMNKFHKQLKRTMPTLGYVKGYFPRAYDVKNIEQNRADLETLLVLEAAKAGIPKFGPQSAKEAVDSILKDQASFTGVDDKTANVFGNDPFSQKTRVLDFISDKVLRQNGFLRSDVDNVLLNYVHNMTRRAGFEEKFSGYEEIISGNPSNKKIKDASAFTHGLMVSFPFRFDNGKGALMSHQDKIEEFGKPDVDYFARNEAYFKVAEKNKWLKKKTSPEGSSWTYYDKNYTLRKAYEAVDDTNDKTRFLKIIDAWEGRIGANDISPKVRDAMSNVLAYQNWTILLFSGFSQLAEVSGLIFRNRDLQGAFDALGEIGKLIAGQDRHERRKLLVDAGFAQKQLTQQAILEGMGVNYQSAFAQKSNNLLFKVNGMNFITNASRVAGAAIAERFIIRHARKAADGNSRSERYLKELGLTQEQAKTLDSKSYKPYADFVREGDLTSPEALNAEAIHKAMFKFVDSAVVRPNSTHRPVWASDPRWMLAWHLKSFMYAYGSVILGGLNTEIQARYKETKSQGKVKASLDAAMPLLVYAIPLLMISGLALELREFVQYSVFGMGSRPFSDGLHGSDYIMELVSRGGALGPMEMGYSFIEDEQKGRSALAGLLGPTAQQLETFLEFDATKTINRSVPILSQNPMMKEWTRELLR